MQLTIDTETQTLTRIENFQKCLADSNNTIALYAIRTEEENNPKPSFLVLTVDKNPIPIAELMLYHVEWRKSEDGENVLHTITQVDLSRLSSLSLLSGDEFLLTFTGATRQKWRASTNNLRPKGLFLITLQFAVKLWKQKDIELKGQKADIENLYDMAADWATMYCHHGPLRSRARKEQRSLFEAIKLEVGKLLERYGVQDAVLEMSTAEQENIEEYLREMNLPIDRVHELEGLLYSKLERLQAENIAFFRETDIVKSLKVRGKKLQDLDQTLNQLETKVKRMKRGIDQIQRQNDALYIEDMSTKNMIKRLESLIAEVSPLTVRDKLSLRGSDFEVKILDTSPDGGLDYIIRAAQTLDSVLKKPCSFGIESMWAVKSQRKEYREIRETFCFKTLRFLVGILTKKRDLSKGSVKETVRRELETYHKLACVMFQMDSSRRDMFVEKYENKMQNFYQGEFKSLFDSSKHSYKEETVESTMKNLAPWPILGSHTEEKAKELRVDDEKSECISITTAFKDIIIKVIDIILSERTFIAWFFKKGAAQNDEEKRDNADMSELSLRESETSFEVDRKEKDDDIAVEESMLSNIFGNCTLLVDEFTLMLQKTDRQNHFNVLTLLVMTEHILRRQNLSNVIFPLTRIQGDIQITLNNFIESEQAWIQSSRPAIKQAGVLLPMQKFPSFIFKGILPALERARKHGVHDLDDSIWALPATKLITTLFSWVENLANKDEKYKDVMLMENFHYFGTVFRDKPGTEVLKEWVEKADAKWKHHMSQYVRWSLKYEMQGPPSLTDFWDKLFSAAQKHGTPDVIKVFVRVDEFLAVQDYFLTAKKLPKRVQNMHKRLQKHLKDNNVLRYHVWRSLEDYFIQSYTKFEKIALRCYRKHVNIPDVNDLREYFQSLAENLPRMDTSTMYSYSSFSYTA